MSSTDTTKPTSANKARPTGTRRAYFTGAATARPTSTTKVTPASTTTARPASTTGSRSASAGAATPTNTNKTSPVGVNSIPPASPNNALRQRMAAELSMAGLAPRSQQTYLNMVDRLAARSWKSVEEISEEEIRQYILNLRDNGAAQGTFKTNWFGLQFLYEHVLGREWALFTKKRSANPDRSAFPKSSLTSRCNVS